MPLFSKSHKNPAEIVKILKENMAILEKQEKKTDKASEEVSKSLQAMKEILCGTTDKEPPTEVVAQLAQELYNSGLLVTLIANLQLIDFEGKKDVSQIFNNILRRQIGTRSPTVEYISAHPHILFMLLKGYESPNIALRCGIMLRECIRHEPLAKIILFSEQFRDFFKYVEMSTFDIASDAFATFKDLLTRHKLLVAEFLEQNYDTIFEDYEKLINSENYVTKRQSLKLLGELILDRHNFAIMTKYISKPENLKLMMNLLRDKSPNIQFEAFHVFKECLVADNALWALRTFVHPGCFLWEIKDKQSAFLQCLLPFSSQEMLDLPPTFLLLFLLPEQDGVSASQHHPKGTL
uniref:Calcium binding protein 39 like n=1 Tax=Anser cygnoides TaxID=8845 RepID=A0A8B9EVM0_ANSCY